MPMLWSIFRMHMAYFYVHKATGRVAIKITGLSIRRGGTWRFIMKQRMHRSKRFRTTAIMKTTFGLYGAHWQYMSKLHSLFFTYYIVLSMKNKYHIIPYHSSEVLMCEVNMPCCCSSFRHMLIYVCRPTVVHRFMVKGTIEERMHSLLQNAISPVNCNSSEETTMTIADLMSLFEETAEDGVQDGVQQDGGLEAVEGGMQDGGLERDGLLPAEEPLVGQEHVYELGQEQVDEMVQEQPVETWHDEEAMVQEELGDTRQDQEYRVLEQPEDIMHDQEARVQEELEETGQDEEVMVQEQPEETRQDQGVMVQEELQNNRQDEEAAADVQDEEEQGATSCRVNVLG